MQPSPIFVIGTVNGTGGRVDKVLEHAESSALLKESRDGRPAA